MQSRQFVAKEKDSIQFNDSHILKNNSCYQTMQSSSVPFFVFNNLKGYNGNPDDRLG